jgi:hypothetical protein
MNIGFKNLSRLNTEDAAKNEIQAKDIKLNERLNSEIKPFGYL